jgi:hypothetical protein
VDDNVRHDTLLVQVTFRLTGKKYVMVASHMDENFDGLRLYLYSPGADSSALVHAHSSPAYDSWTMLPTFFHDPRDSSAHIVLANFGERESWGQKVMVMDSTGFTDLGFIDAALPERTTDGDSTVLKRRNIGPVSRCIPDGGGLRFEFACDSVFLYDDLRGGMDRVIPAAWLHYTWDPKTGMTLWFQGEARRPEQTPI